MPNIELHFPAGRNEKVSKEALVRECDIWEFLKDELPELVGETVISQHNTTCFGANLRLAPYIRLYYDATDGENEIAQLKEFLSTLADVEVIQLEEFLAKSSS